MGYGPDATRGKYLSYTQFAAAFRTSPDIVRLHGIDNPIEALRQVTASGDHEIGDLRPGVMG
jgi:hypothetical protein